MIESIVNIQSKTNQSFGTGFVVDKDSNGVYILTCKHVLEELGSFWIESFEAKQVSQNHFVDLALIYAKNLHLEPLALGKSNCFSKQIKVIGFSNFNQEVHQKHQINAELFNESIELHSNTDSSYYTVRKIQSLEGESFSRGHSGSPVICQSTGEVIAVVSNKRGHKIAYAVPIGYLKEIWKEMPTELIKERVTQTEKEKESSPKKSNKTLELFTAFSSLAYSFIKEFQFKPKAPVPEKSFFSKIKKKLFSFFLILIFITGGYFWFKHYVVLSYKVVHIRTNSTLNVRSGKDEQYTRVAELPSNTHGIIVTQCQHNRVGKKWCYIQYANIKGWVRSKYITIDEVHILAPIKKRFSL